MTRSEMQTVVRRILELDRQCKAGELEDDVAVPGPPAAEDDLTRLVAAAGMPLPPSYLEVLRIHDGIRAFYWIAEDLLSTAEQIREPDFAKHWHRPELRLFIMGDDFEGVAFDLATRRPDGEMEVVELARNVETIRWPALGDFLSGYRDRLQGWHADGKVSAAKVER